MLLQKNLLLEILRNAQAGNIDQLKIMKCKHLDIHWTALRYEKTGDTILHVAARLGYLHIIEYLLESYTPKSVNCKNNRDKTALHEAAQFAQHKCINVLLANGADVNALKQADWTPLMLACTKIKVDDSYKTVQALLQAGALVNYTNKDGWSSLHLICREGCAEILKLLLDYNVDVFKTSKNGRSALHVAALHGHSPIVSILLKYGLDVNGRDNCGNSPLHEAILGGHVEVSQLLLDNNADVAVKNNLGFGLLHSAASVCYLDSVKYLVRELNFDLNCKSISCLTALHCAAKGGHKDVYEYLVNSGADINIGDKFGRTPSDYLRL